MRTRSRAQVRFLVDHLRSCLDQPHIHGDEQRFLCIARSLSRLVTVFGEYVEQIESPDGALTTLSDPGLLPLTHEIQQAQDLRRRHPLVTARLQNIALLFHGALHLLSAGKERHVRDDPSEEWQQRRGWAVLRALEPCIADVLVELESCLAKADVLLPVDPAAAGSN